MAVALASFAALVAGLLAEELTRSALLEDVGLVVIVGSLGALAATVPALVAGTEHTPSDGAGSEPRG